MKYLLIILFTFINYYLFSQNNEKYDFSLSIGSGGYYIRDFNIESSINKYFGVFTIGINTKIYIPDNNQLFDKSGILAGPQIKFRYLRKDKIHLFITCQKNWGFIGTSSNDNPYDRVSNSEWGLSLNNNFSISKSWFLSFSISGIYKKGTIHFNYSGYRMDGNSNTVAIDFSLGILKQFSITKKK